MNKSLFISFWAILLVFSTSLNAQTNKTGDNLVPGSETRIIKKDTTALDIDVLSQLELGDYTMGEEVK